MHLAPYIGIPYSVPETDCWGICRKLGAEVFGKHYPEFFYDISNNEALAPTFIEVETNYSGRWQSVSFPDKGDIIIFRIKGLVVHCGIVVSATEFIHSLKGRNSCLEQISDWEKRIVGIYRWLGS